MPRTLFGNKRMASEDKYTRKSGKYSEWEITKEKLKIVLYIALGALYIYIILYYNSTTKLVGTEWQ